jgi:HlyD family secretion protein
MNRVLPRLLLALLLLAGGAFAWRQYHAQGGETYSSETSGGAAPSWLDRIAVFFGFDGVDRSNRFSGYVEADYVMVASSIGGTLVALDVERGDRVEAGAPLYRLDDLAERAAVDEANERLKQAEAQLANLMTGKRQPEIEAIIAQRAQAEAALRQSEAEYRRQLELQRTGVAARKAVDDARSRRDQDRSRIAELDAELEVAHMPARSDEIEAAEAAVAAAHAALAQAQWRLDQKIGSAPAAGTVVDTLYRPGEMVPAGLPVVQLLPPANLKIRFFVPEALVSTIAVGDPVSVVCDGCGAPIAATIRFISPRAEFTPPVIYSRDERTRLVFMVEARPSGRLDALRVGQPVDVSLVRP